LRATDGVGWITALKSVSIRALVDQGHLQLGLVDEVNLVELSSPEYPGERLVACRNPELAKLRAHKRHELLAATEIKLDKIRARVDAGKLVGSDEIGVCVGKVVNKYKVAKHFELTIDHNTVTFARKLEAIAAESALDGIARRRTELRPRRGLCRSGAPTCRPRADGLDGRLGIYTVFGGSRFAIMAPTSATATVSAAAALSLSSIAAAVNPAAYVPALLALVLLSGGLLMMLALARQGQLSAFVSRPVLRGFAFALAVTIVIKQLPDTLSLGCPKAQLLIRCMC
jgi:hypothetical protein